MKSKRAEGYVSTCVMIVIICMLLSVFVTFAVAVNAVESSRFISASQSNSLVSKLYDMASIHQASELNRHLYVDGRVKSDSRTLYYTVDLIHKAINDRKRIRFKYIEYTAEKKKVYKHNGCIYEFSPYAMLWHDDRYYVLG